jgi:WD40 repeat protein
MEILPMVEEHWNELLQTLEGQSGPVSAVTFSLDGKLLASVSYDRTVRLRDATTGAALQTLEGHSSLVFVVAFLPDDKQLVSASYAICGYGTRLQEWRCIVSR